MPIKTSLLALAIATAMAGAFVLAAPITAHASVVSPSGDEAAEAADKAADEAKEANDDATEKANDDAKEANEDAKDAKHEAAERPYVPATSISAQALFDQLTKAGYKDIEDIEFDDEANVWKAEAKDPSGQKVELTLDQNDGHILTSKKD